MDRYEAKVRIMKLVWLMDTIQSVAIKHLDAGNRARVEVLDARFNAAEDEVRRIQEEARRG